MSRTYPPLRRPLHDHAALSKEPLRLLFGSPATLVTMTKGKRPTVSALAGAIVLASGAYALGSQAGDGSAAAARNGERAGYGHGFGPGRPGMRPGFGALAARPGVGEADLR